MDSWPDTARMTAMTLLPCRLMQLAVYALSWLKGIPAASRCGADWDGFGCCCCCCGSLVFGSLIWIRLNRNRPNSSTFSACHVDASLRSCSKPRVNLFWLLGLGFRGLGV